LYASDEKNKCETIINKQLIENLKSLIRQEGNVDFWWSDKYDQKVIITIIIILLNFKI
jgi:hypothetical protein